MIYWIILIFALIIRYLTLNVLYRKKVNELDKFIYALLYRGYAEEGPGGNSELGLNAKRIALDLALIKYKEKGKIGLYIFLQLKHIKDDKINILKEKLKKREIYYYIREFSKPAYLIDMEQNIEEIKEIISFIGEKIFNETELGFTLAFIGACTNPNKLIDFEDTKELDDKGIDIKIPIKKWQWILWKIKHPREKI